MLENTVIRINSESAELKEGGTIPAWTVIWAAGVAPNPLLAGLDVPRDERGYIPCEPDIRVKDCENVWGIGDCAVNPEPEGNPRASAH